MTLTGVDHGLVRISETMWGFIARWVAVTTFVVLATQTLAYQLHDAIGQQLTAELGMPVSAGMFATTWLAMRPFRRLPLDNWLVDVSRETVKRPHVARNATRG